jgi:hypothetical protein
MNFCALLMTKHGCRSPVACMHEHRHSCHDATLCYIAPDIFSHTIYHVSLFGNCTWYYGFRIKIVILWMKTCMEDSKCGYQKANALKCDQQKALIKFLPLLTMIRLTRCTINGNINAYNNDLVSRQRCNSLTNVP